MRRGFLQAAGFSFLFPLSLGAQGVLRGTVREDSTGRPLSGVEILIEGAAQRAVTDGSGRYLIAGVPAGSQVALFRLVGFRPVRHVLRVAPDDTIWVNPLLVGSVLELPPLEVRVEEKVPRGFGLEAFEERRRMGFGKFIDSTVLRRMESHKVADVLRRHTSVKLIPGGHGELWAEGARKPGPNANRCWMQVIVDGVVVFRPERDLMRGAGEPPRRPDFTRDFTVAELEAMEVYYGAAQTPGEFSGTSAACGTIVLWTRRALRE